MADYYNPIVPSVTVSIPDDITSTILRNGTRAGNTDRDHTVQHIKQATIGGYITPDEASRRIKTVETITKISDLHTLTSDLPAPADTRQWFQRYNWNNKTHATFTLITAMITCLIVAAVPLSLLCAANLFPRNILGMGVGVTTLILGVGGFFGCVIGLATKTSG